MIEDYYKSVEEYYDDDSISYQDRLESNLILNSMRDDFRKITNKYIGTLDRFKNVLEIGCGTGVDLEYFSRAYPDVFFLGIDISQGMLNIATERLKNAKNVKLLKAKVEDIEKMDTKFDLIYTYFGALNTVEDLNRCAEIIWDRTSENGIVVITVVNKYYLLGLLFNLLRGRFRKAFARVRDKWTGYSPTKKLNSHPYSYRQVKNAFKRMKLVYRKGYSIIAPPWYSYGKTSMGLYRVLNSFDSILNYFPVLWSLGEYSLYVFKKHTIKV